MSIMAFKGRLPRFGERVFVGHTAVIIGDVRLGDRVNVWPGAVLRGDVEPIDLGRETSFQDNSVAHCDPGFPLIVGECCVIGHGVILHGARIGNHCQIGMGSTVLNGAAIGDHSIVGAGSLVTGGKVFPPRSLIMGSPARVVRSVTAEELEELENLPERYVKRALEYLNLGLGAVLP